LQFNVPDYKYYIIIDYILNINYIIGLDFISCFLIILMTILIPICIYKRGTRNTKKIITNLITTAKVYVHI
jgi:NADH:ubiquinone oxidoreductase subunit 4 (subunit M)